VKRAAIPLGAAALLVAGALTWWPVTIAPPHRGAIALLGCAAAFIVMSALVRRQVAYVYAGAALLVVEYWLSLPGRSGGLGVEAPAFGVLLYLLVELVDLWTMMSSPGQVESRVLRHRALFALAAAVAGAVISGLGLITGSSVPAAGAASLALAGVAAVAALALPVALAAAVIAQGDRGERE
jgi:hypothetical protein